MGESEVTRTVFTCDLCERETTSSMLSACPVCGKEVCFSCHHELYDLYQTNICRECNHNEPAHAIVMDLHKRWLRQRDKAIERLKQVTP